DLEGVANRRKAFTVSCQREEYFVKGLNRVLSIDGHDKLSRFSFEIYGAIDAYSHYIVWYYVDISNRTAVSVNKQYLRLLRTTLCMSKLICSNKGMEIVLLAQSHITLRRANKPDLPFHKAYSYGKSTKNQRIEAWWNLLMEGQTQEWKVFFAELEEEGQFDGGDIDKSCLQYIYMDIICSHIHQFIAIHNSHSISEQCLRSHYLPTGQPFLLYHYPEGVRDYKEPVNIDTLAALKAEVKDFNLDQYLSEETLKLYAHLLSTSRYPLEFIYGNMQHKSAYIFLREKVADYIQNGEEIKLFNSPTGAEDWIQAHYNHEIERHQDQDHSMVIEDTDNEGINEEGIEESESDRIVPGEGELKVEKGKESEYFWESLGDEEDSNELEINDGYFLDL
ncbi:hypothetical protein L873DRAFT_1713249, partial [Choiromyces venosus 120613-1]